ncbi:MAG: hypothetical protein WCG80_06020 [Spirochaetales bacterium]
MLDTAGTIMPAVTDHHNTTFFRLTAELTDVLERSLLQRAVDRLSTRYSQFYVQLAKTWSGWTLQPLPRPPLVEDDGPVPCKGADIHVPGTPLVRFRVRGAVLALEMSHVLSDGFGALVLLKDVLAEYLLLSPNEPYRPEEWVDSYVRNYRPGVAWPEPYAKAWRVPGERLPGPDYRASGVSMSAEKVRECASRFGLSITEYLASVQLGALEDLRLALGREAKSRRLPLTLMVPADLRRSFPSISLRNFSGVLLASLPWSQEPTPFDVICSRVRLALQTQKSPDQLSRQVARNVWAARFIGFHLLPRVLLNPLRRVFYGVFGESAITSHLSNLGAVELPPGVASFVRSLAFLPGASQRTGTNVGVVSYQGRLVLSFGSVLVSDALETSLLERLGAEGLEPLPCLLWP